MQIAALLASAVFALLAAKKHTTHDTQIKSPPSNGSEDDTRSAKAALKRIYGPPIGTAFSGERVTHRTSSTQYPYFAATLALMYNPDDPEESWREEFKGGGIIISETIVIATCSQFFTVDDLGKLIRIEEDSILEYLGVTDKVLDYLIRAGQYSDPKATGKAATANPQSVPIQKMTPHPRCSKFLLTNQKSKYDSVALQLVTPLTFNEYVRPSSFYTLDFEFMEDKLEEMQQVHSRCFFILATDQNELYASIVEIIDDRECNNLFCMIGDRQGKVCRDPYNFYEEGKFCTLSRDGDVPCGDYGGVLTCDRQVYGMAVLDYCQVCAPHVIAKPMSILYFAKKYLDDDTTDDSSKEEGLLASEKSETGVVVKVCFAFYHYVTFTMISITPPYLTSTEFSTELELHTGEPVDGHPLWASRFLVTDPEACVETYRELIRCGAGMVHTNTYQASPEGFIKHMGLSEREACDVIKSSVALCEKAVQEERKPDVVIAGAVGSINAWRADGSEYSGEHCEGITAEEYLSKHRPRVQALVEGGVKFLCFETLPCSAEALALIDLLKEYPGVKAWISFFGRNTKEISNGEIFADVAVKCWENGKGQVEAVGVNCLDPAWVSPLFASLKEANPNVPFVAYPNSGEKYDTQAQKWTPCETEKTVADYLPEWLDMGITYVGGCCRNYAKDLSAMKKAIDEWKSSKKAK